MQIFINELLFQEILESDTLDILVEFLAFTSEAAALFCLIGFMVWGIFHIVGFFKDITRL